MSPDHSLIKTFAQNHSVSLCSTFYRSSSEKCSRRRLFEVKETPCPIVERREPTRILTSPHTLSPQNLVLANVGSLGLERDIS